VLYLSTFLVFRFYRPRLDGEGCSNTDDRLPMRSFPLGLMAQIIGGCQQYARRERLGDTFMPWQRGVRMRKRTCGDFCDVIVTSDSAVGVDEQGELVIAVRVRLTSHLRMHGQMSISYTCPIHFSTICVAHQTGATRHYCRRILAGSFVEGDLPTTERSRDFLLQVVVGVGVI
jgi:hypothetical protein